MRTKFWLLVVALLSINSVALACGDDASVRRLNGVIDRMPMIGPITGTRSYVMVGSDWNDPPITLIMNDVEYTVTLEAAGYMARNVTFPANDGEEFYVDATLLLLNGEYVPVKIHVMTVY